MKAIAQAPGKIIVTGEHFVVHGSKAMAAALDRHARVEARPSDENFIISKNLGLEARLPKYVPVKLRPIAAVLENTLHALDSKMRVCLVIDSDIPPSSGLGSSSAVAVASVAALSSLDGQRLTKSEVVDFAMVSERMVHKKPSGIDVNVAVYGGVILFKMGSEPRQVAPKSTVDFVVGESGVERETSKMISKVSRAKDKHPRLFGALVSSSTSMTEVASNTLQRHDLTLLGSILNFYHGLLSWLGASAPIIDMMVERAIQAGALGAKLTGAGGGGSMIALPPLNEAERVASAIRELGVRAHVVSVPQKGLMVWKEDR